MVEEVEKDISEELLNAITSAGEFDKSTDAHALREVLSNKVLCKALGYILEEADAKSIILMAIDLDNEQALKEAKAIQMEAKSLIRSVEILIGLTIKEGED